MRKTDFDKYADDYEHMLAKGLEGFGGDTAYYHRYKAALVKALARPGTGSILDYGCGVGNNLALLAEAFPGAALAGCDISPASLETAGKRCARAGLYDLSAGETPGEHDLVFVSNVLHHVRPPERDAFMAAVAAAMAPGGELFVFEHNPYNPVTRRIVADCPFDADAVLLFPGEMRRLVDRAGLCLRRLRYTLFFPAKLKRLDPLNRYLGRLPLGGQYYALAVKEDPA